MKWRRALAGNKSRIGFDIDKVFKEKLLENIMPGTLSSIGRSLFEAFSDFVESVGIRESYKAILNKNIKIVRKDEN